MHKRDAVIAVDNENGGTRDEKQEEISWGYQIKDTDGHPDRYLHISRCNLLLDDSESAATVRRNLLKQTLGPLKLKSIIKEYEDVSAHFLGELFKHTWNQLKAQHNLDRSCSIQFVSSVPTHWKLRN
jgi:hypothetical protein